MFFVLRLCRAILLCLIILSTTPGAWAAPLTERNNDDLAVAQPAQTDSPFQSTPDTLAVDVPLGTRQQATFTITNDDSIARTPRLYEAYGVPPKGVVPRRVVPEALRRVPLPDQTTRIDEQITRDLAASPDGRTEFLVFLTDQADLAAAYSITDWAARGEWVARTLSSHAQQSQQELRTWLEQQGLPYQSFWIANAIAVRGTQADVAELANRADVALLRANHTVSLEPEKLSAERSQRAIPLNCDPDANNICWNLRQIGADRVWYEFGVSGEGITVANIDSGVQYDHPALYEQYRGYRATGDDEHNYNWFDPRQRSLVPEATGNHGTHTMGTMVAQAANDPDQPAVGVAPGARWMAARSCQERSCSEVDLLESSQWMLNPTDLDGDNPRPDLRPQIVNNSWADSEGGNQKYAGYTTAWQAAGMFPVFAAGNNQHSTCSTITSPADYPGVVGVGATDKNDTIAYFSSIGPSLDDDLKPDITAPGQSIVSTFAGEGLSYGTNQGTSMAAPHVAATVALMWSANPALIGDYDATYAILTQSAEPRTDLSFGSMQYANCQAETVPNNVYGYGRLDAYAAVAQATVNVPWLGLPGADGPLAAGESQTINLALDARRVAEPGVYRARVLLHTDDLTRSPQVVEVAMNVTPTGNEATVSGQLRDEGSNVPLSGTVAVSDGPTLSVDETGRFTTTLVARPEPYVFTALSSGYVSETTQITIDAGIANTLEFLLVADLPVLLADTTILTATLGFNETANFETVIENAGTQPLSYTLEVPSEQFGVWRSDEADGPAQTWITLPPTSPALELIDDGSTAALPLGFDFPFYGKFIDEVYLSANGFLSTVPLESSRAFSISCLPIPESFGGAIVPLRADLDPAQGGTVRHAQVAEGFVVTFEDVPLHEKSDQRFTFQVVLTRDGRIVFNYQQLGTLDRTVSVGVQRNTQATQTIGCGQDTPIADGLTIELRPQPRTTMWLSTPEEQGSVAPGQQATIAIEATWIGPGPQQPYKGAVLLRSTDPRRPEVRLPVTLTTTEAPYRRWLMLVGYAGF